MLHTDKLLNMLYQITATVNHQDILYLHNTSIFSYCVWFEAENIERMKLNTSPVLQSNFEGLVLDYFHFLPLYTSTPPHFERQILYFY